MLTPPKSTFASVFQYFTLLLNDADCLLSVKTVLFDCTTL